MCQTTVLAVAMLAGMLMPSAGLAQSGYSGWHHRYHESGHSRIHHPHHGGVVGHHRHRAHHHRHLIHYRTVRHRHWGYGGLKLAAARFGYSASVDRNCFLTRRWVHSPHGPHRIWVRVCI